MIAYNNEWLKNLQAIESAEGALRRKLINKEEMEAIRQRFVSGFYTPNTFIRIGLFLLTLVICNFSFGLISLFLIDSLDKAFAAMAIFFGLLSYGTLEYLVRTRHHYKSGGDDALLWIAASFVIGGISVLTGASELQNCTLVCLVALAATLRFGDRVMTAVAFLSFFGMVFYLFGNYGPIARAVLPFIFIAFATAGYFLARMLQGKEGTVLYRANLQVVQILSLITCYVSANYFVVRELSIELFQLNLPAGVALPFGWFFWGMTCLLPMVYLGFGIKLKDRLLLRVGLLVFALTLLTLKFYFYIAAEEVLMTFLGLALLVGAYGLIKFLAKPRFGIVYAETEDDATAQVESLIIAETFSTIPAQAEPSRFGGGNFGGAGSSGEF